MAKKAGTKLKYAPITNQVGAYTKAQIKAYWKAEKAKKRAELDEANEKAQIAATAKHPRLWSKPMKPRVMRKHNDIIAQKQKKSAKGSALWIASLLHGPIRLGIGVVYLLFKIKQQMQNRTCVMIWLLVC